MQIFPQALGVPMCLVPHGLKMCVTGASAQVFLNPNFGEESALPGLQAGLWGSGGLSAPRPRAGCAAEAAPVYCLLSHLTMCNSHIRPRQSSDTCRQNN